MALQLEEVLRQHFGAREQRPGEQDAALRRMRAEHLKARGDEAIKQGNYRQAWERYDEAIALAPDKQGLHALHSNRSLAYHKAGRHAEALDDADVAAELAPAWPKAHWRRAAALLALKRVPEAVEAYASAWRLDKRDAEGRARLWATVQRLTREQLARCVLGLLGALQVAGTLEPPQVEEASEQEQAEALFRLLRISHQGQPRPGPYYRRYLHWLQQGMQQGEAYLERAALHNGAKCYLQARADAQAAVAVLLKEQQMQQAQHAQQQRRADAEQPADQSAEQPSAGTAAITAAERGRQLVLAYQRLGEAFLAERDHPDRDCRQAAKAFLRATELLADRGKAGEAAAAAVQEGLQEASEQLTMDELDQIRMEIYEEGDPSGGSVQGARWQGASARLAPGQRLFRLALRLAFPSAAAADCTSRARELLRAGVAATAGVDPQRVSIERIAAPSLARRQPHLAVHLHVQVGSDLLKASALAKAVSQAQQAAQQEAGSQEVAQRMQEAEVMDMAEPAEGAASTGAAAAAAAAVADKLAALLGGEALVAALGRPDPAHCSCEIEDITPACAGVSEPERAEQEAVNRGDTEPAPEQDRRLAVPARPKMELELPYRLYRLVRADGSLAERTDKHPFCMSRVYYDASEKPEEVWAEMADGSCRWRQTGGEVKVLALRVPADLPSKQLRVDIQPYSVKVWNRASGELYLEGELERGVVPEDCFWTHCGGAGEDGCALYLRKMNLELLQKHWMHSEMWWPRLFRCHGEIAWDDYEKDYSDLPEEVLQRHRVAEAIKGDERQAETTERERREALQERDDVRKRARQERLNELRSGSRKACRALPAAAAS